MKSRSIVFNDTMVRALIAGRKTQARKISKVPTFLDRADDVSHPDQPLRSRSNPFSFTIWQDGEARELSFTCPYGLPGERIWVKETHAWSGTAAGWVYRADGEVPVSDRCAWFPAATMRRDRSRIALEVTDIRIQRLQEISEEDARAEGVEEGESLGVPGWKDYRSGAFMCTWPTTSYRTLWESINGPGSWDANPWVWCVSFKKVTP